VFRKSVSLDEKEINKAIEESAKLPTVASLIATSLPVASSTIPTTANTTANATSANNTSDSTARSNAFRASLEQVSTPNMDEADPPSIQA
jgi:hypothetical protein